MTAADEPRAHEAGQALDAEIQRRVFGTRALYCRYGEPWVETDRRSASDRLFYIPSGKPWRTHHIDAMPVPRYSSDMAAAWLVVERITDPSFRNLYTPHEPSPTWMPPGTRFAYWFDGAALWSMSASDAAEAICRAALAVVGEAGS